MMNTTDKVKLYRRLLRRAEAQLRTAQDDDPIPIANPEDATTGGYHDRPRRLFYMTFGAYGWDKCYCWADSAEAAIEEGAAWLRDTHPDSDGLILEDDLFNDKGLWEEARQNLGPGASDEDLSEYVEQDLYFTSSGYLVDWTIEDVYDDHIVSDVAALSEYETRQQDLDINQNEYEDGMQQLRQKSRGAAAYEQRKAGGRDRIPPLIEAAIGSAADQTSQALERCDTALAEYGHGDYPNQLADLANLVRRADAALQEAMELLYGSEYK